MKHYKKIIFSLAMMSLMLFADGCSGLLEEHPRSQIVPSFFSTPAGLLGGIAGVYNDIRSTWGTEGFTLAQMAGTDEHLAGGSAGNPRIFTYNGLVSTDFSGSFGLYTDINTLNGILEIGPTSKDLTPETLKAYLGQAQFLRAFLYFYLVQTFGDVPLHTKFITTPSQADSKAPAADVYSLIVQDLIDASNNLPNQPTAPFLGKPATKAAAQWLLAKVYLTRGWLTDSNADFQLAYNVANDVITNKAAYGLDLWQDYADAFRPANDYGKETIFVSDHSNDAKFGVYQTGAAGGNGVNVTPWMGLFNGPSVIGANSTVAANGQISNAGPQMLFRDVPFGRPFTRIRPNTNYILNQAFADRVNDSRYDKTFQYVWISNITSAGANAYAGTGVTGSRGTLTPGLDTAVYMPSVAITGAPQAFGARPFKGIIVNPTMQSNTVYPYMKKLADPNRASPNDPSTRPVILARFAEMYLIAAEAAFKLGQSANAVTMVNVLRKRAAFRKNDVCQTAAPLPITGPTCDRYKTGVTQASAETAIQAATPGAMTIDFILDERTREFYGESQRWPDLVRTKSLVSRVTTWNPEASPYIKPFHMLRPVPQDEIDRVVAGPKFQQNDGY